MGIKEVRLPGVPDEAYAAARKVILKMRANNQTGIKAAYYQGAVVLARRTQGSEVLFPVTPRLETYNHLRDLRVIQEADKDEIRWQGFNELGGTKANKLYTSAEVFDPLNTETAYIRSADDPDLFRVLGANNYNGYESAQNNSFFKTVIDNIILQLLDAEIVLASLAIMEATNFFARQSDDEYALFNYVVSQVPSDMSVEDVIYSMTLGTFYMPGTRNGISIIPTQQYHGDFIRLSTVWCRYDNAGELQVCCQAVRDVFEPSLNNAPSNRDEWLNPFNGEVAFSKSPSYPLTRYISIPARDVFRLKTTPRSIGLTSGLNAFSGIEPVAGNFVTWSEVFSTTFSVSGDDPMIPPEQPHVEYMGWTLPWVNDAQLIYNLVVLTGTGIYEWDYSLPGLPEAVDRDEIRAQSLFPLNTVPQTDYVADSVAVIPLRVEMTYDPQNDVYSGTYYYNIIYDPFAGNEDINDVFSYRSLSTLINPSTYKVHDVTSSYTSSNPDFQRWIRGLTSIFLTSQYQVTTIANDTLFVNEGSTLDFNGRTQKKGTAWFTTFTGRYSFNREYYIGTAWHELVETVFEYDFSQTVQVGDPVQNVSTHKERRTLTKERTTTDRFHVVLDFDGEDVTVSSMPMATITQSAIGDFYSATWLSGSGANPTTFSPGFNSGTYEVTMPGYTMQWRPAPSDTPRTLYSVNPTTYRYTKDYNRNVNPDPGFNTSIDSPDRIFFSVEIDAQNRELPLTESPNIWRYPDTRPPRLHLRYGGNFLFNTDTDDTALRVNGSTVGNSPSLYFAENNNAFLAQTLSTDPTTDENINKHWMSTYSVTTDELYDNGVYLHQSPNTWREQFNYSATQPSFTINYEVPIFLLAGNGDKPVNVLDELPNIETVIPYGRESNNQISSFTQAGSYPTFSLFRPSYITRITNSDTPLPWQQRFITTEPSFFPTTIFGRETKPIYPRRAFTFYLGELPIITFGGTLNQMYLNESGAFRLLSATDTNTATDPFDPSERAIYTLFGWMASTGTKLAVQRRNFPFQDGLTGQYHDFLYNEWMSRHHLINAAGTPAPQPTTEPPAPPAEPDSFSVVSVFFFDQLTLNREE